MRLFRRWLVILAILGLVASGCASGGGSGPGPLAAVDAEAAVSEDSDVEFSNDEQFEEDDTGLSPEELLASELALRDDLTLTGSAPSSIVAGEPFIVMFEVSVRNQATSVEVELAVPEGVSLVGGDCAAEEEAVVCIVGDPDDPANDSVVYSIEPAVLSAQLVVDQDAALATGGVIAINAVVTEFLSQQVLSEATDINPDDNVINLQIDVAPSIDGEQNTSSEPAALSEEEIEDNEMSVDSTELEAEETTVTGEEAAAERAAQDTIDIELVGSVVVGVDGSSATVTGSVRSIDSAGVSGATVSYEFSDGVSPVGMSSECVEEDAAVVCALAGLLPPGGADGNVSESFETTLDVVVTDGAVNPTATATGSSRGNPVSNDPFPENNVVVFDLVTGEVR